MARHTRPKRISPHQMDMSHRRSADIDSRSNLRTQLDEVLADVPEQDRMRVARAATLSIPQALKILDTVAAANDSIDDETLKTARGILERFSSVPM